MKIPPGITVNIGRKEYREGMELPANAPESVKKRCADRAAELAKNADTEKAEAAKKRQELIKKVVEAKLGTPEEIAKLSDTELAELLSKGNK